MESRSGKPFSVELQVSSPKMEGGGMSEVSIQMQDEEAEEQVDDVIIRRVIVRNG